MDMIRGMDPAKLQGIRKVSSVAAYGFAIQAIAHFLANQRLVKPGSDQGNLVRAFQAEHDHGLVQQGQGDPVSLTRIQDNAGTDLIVMPKLPLKLLPVPRFPLQCQFQRQLKPAHQAHPRRPTHRHPPALPPRRRCHPLRLPRSEPRRKRSTTSSTTSLSLPTSSQPLRAALHPASLARPTITPSVRA